MQARSAEWVALQSELAAAGVRGSDELGRFVSNVAVFGASSFDERAAMPVLVAALPGLTDPRLVGAVAAHLRRPWARPAAYDALHDAFRRWAPLENGPGWTVGDALASASTVRNVDDLLDLGQDTTYGRSRQMLVYALWRFAKAGPEVERVVRHLLWDPQVGQHAMASLRRIVGPADTVVAVEAVERATGDAGLRQQAGRELRKLRKAVAS